MGLSWVRWSLLLCSSLSQLLVCSVQTPWAGGTIPSAGFSAVQNIEAQKIVVFPHLTFRGRVPKTAALHPGSWALAQGCALTGIALSPTALPMGDTPMDGMAVEDLGPVVLSVLKSPEEYIGRVIGLSTGKLTVAEYAAAFSQQTGKTVEASKVGSTPWCVGCC